MTCNNPDHKCKGEIVAVGRYQECDQCGYRPPVAQKNVQPVRIEAPKAEPVASVS